MIEMDVYVRGLFVIVNMILGLYIVFYAYLFLVKTKSYPDRKPWEFLFIAAIFFFISQIFAIFWLYGTRKMFGMELDTFRKMLEFFYSVFILIAFITQSHLILNSDLIIISKKLKKTQPKNVISEELFAEDEEKELKKKKKKAKKGKSKKKALTPDEEIDEEFGEKKVEKEMKEEHFKSEIIDE